MAKKKHLAKLREGAEAWNQWRKDHHIIPNFSHADLRYSVLPRANLYKAKLSNTDLGHANLSFADLSYANLSQADFRHADLSGADLRGAKLRETNLSTANLSTANLSHANLSGEDLGGAYLREANLSEANLRGANLREADLSGADLRSANLHEANLRGADLRGASFHGADLGYTDFGHTKILETIFANVDLTNTKGMETCTHYGPSVVDHRTLSNSGQLSLRFLRGCGLPDTLIDYLPSLLNQPIQYYSCFISYSHADKAFAQRIYDTLQGKGIRCWLDEHEILPGDDIYEQVDFGIRLWDKTLLCCSESSLTSWWVDNEIDTAFDKERQIMNERKQRVLALIPLDLDGYLFSDDFKSGKKQQLHSRFAADFRNWKRNHDKFERQLDKVIKALQLDGGRKPPPEPNL